jgi:hypothetical protein
MQEEAHKSNGCVLGAWDEQVECDEVESRKKPELEDGAADR